MYLLIVDDIATNRKLLRVTLEAEGHTTLEAADGVEALQILARDRVDAVISDILMPNMDGFRLCHEIRKSERLHALPFIIYTSTYTSSDDMKLAQTVGADKYLTKPAPTAAVLVALREVMDKQAARPVPSTPVVEETYVLQQYSQTLVHKLEEKNTELKDTLDKLQRAHERIVELNYDLERRVQERTA
jgi:CheY-like chemotaxis protein